MFWMTVAGIFFTIVLLVAIYDVTQKKHAILRNFPVLGHFRFLIESVGPEFRQYIVASNDEERPFTRDQRSWVYASAKAENNYFGFGSDSEMERSSNYHYQSQHLSDVGAAQRRPGLRSRIQASLR